MLIVSRCFTDSSYASYIGSPARLFAPEDESGNYNILAEAAADITYDRAAKHQSDDAALYYYGGSLGLILKNSCFIYGGAGAAKLKQEYLIRGENVRWDTDYGFTWLAGAAFKVHEIRLKGFYDSRFLVSFDGQYRNTDLEPEKINIGRAEYDMPHEAITYSTIEYNDWRLSLCCTLVLGRFSPYAGLKYSDFESCVRVRRGNTMYEKNNAEADNNFGIFAGAGVNVTDSIYAGLEASFIDEYSVGASLSWKF